ncbi:hypothetical protein BCR33DRAFT_251740 [Rhizoclosmatium globosum]|uniref:Ubiquitin-like domain-containing protein n=1 Tax=Rhizoclosmatium globosum TaxID=329046 RepID=A0A1Y2CAI7_9FUNG|nr:hypothetical protein BCR33DRAFT_251740 [Rhizoclosmatium globosum]|eukprot:ORY43874.1 hypothetical protein BCR33DRAFT_251740 [Rhizoclosmatium globosum]
MRLTLTDENGNIKVVDVSADLSVNDFKALAEVELQIPASGMRILHNGRDLQASATLQGSGVVQDDMLLVLRTGPPQQQDQAEAIRTQLLNDPATLQRVAAQNP